MKIRTDFVTNSSSSNYVTICIKNPKLAEIIRAAKVCKETGKSGGNDHYYYDRLHIDESEQIVKFKLEITDILEENYGLNAIYNEGFVDPADATDLENLPNIGYPPEHLSGLSQSMIRLLKEVKEYRFPNYDLPKICNALEQNSEIIITDMESADWVYDSEGYGEAALYNWFWAFSTYIAEGAHLDYLPSSVGALISFHYDKENGESLKQEYSYSEPYQKNITEEDLEDVIDFIVNGYDEDDGNPDVPIFEDNEENDLIPMEEDDLNWQGYDDDFTEEDE